MSDGIPTLEEKIEHLQERVAKLERILEETLQTLSHDHTIERRTSRLLHEQYMGV